MPLDLDALVEASAVFGELAGGVSPAVLVRRSSDPRAVAVLAGRVAPRRSYNVSWTPEEDAFLRRHNGWISDQEIGRRLGRTRIAVILRRKRELRLPCPANIPLWLTGEQIAQGLSIDGHLVAWLVDRGILPGHYLPYEDQRLTRVVDRVTLLRWMVNPLNWIYFKPDRVGAKWGKAWLKRHAHKYDEVFWQKARRLVLRRREGWDDEWLTPRQVAQLHGLTDPEDHKFVNTAIRKGRLPATRWSNWWILRSDATAPGLVLCTGRGKGRRGVDRGRYSPAADAFLVLAFAVGLNCNMIDPMMGNKKQADYRLRRLKEWSRIPKLIKAHALPVKYKRRTGDLFSDWREVKRRFPCIERAMGRLKNLEPMTHADLCVARGVLRSWCTRHARTKEQRAMARSLYSVGVRKAWHFRVARERMKAWGWDPCGRRRK